MKNIILIIIGIIYFCIAVEEKESKNFKAITMACLIFIIIILINILKMLANGN